MEGYGNENPGAFQPTRPLRGATRWSTAPKAKALFQPTRPLRGATAAAERGRLPLQISTHAPLAGRDREALDGVLPPVRFQPTRPLRGATPPIVTVSWWSIFQPTRPLRGATTASAPRAPICRNFNPRAPCGARRFVPSSSPLQSTHFNPRAPCGARLHLAVARLVVVVISTHAPLAGRDYCKPAFPAYRTDFNPRAPCGARLLQTGLSSISNRFQPTRPLRGATAKVYKSLCTFLR